MNTNVKPAFNPAAFTPPKLPAEMQYLKDMCLNGRVRGGAHLPSVKRLATSDAFLIGWPNIKGCFSARVALDETRSKYIDLALYDEDPKTIALDEDYRIANAVYREVPYVNGWGFHAIHLLNQMLEACDMPIYKWQPDDNDHQQEGESETDYLMRAGYL